MSSQGIPASVGATGYVYSSRIRDASEWTKVLKEKRQYYSYNSTLNTGNRNTEDPWLKTGNGFRLTYNFGQFACGGCTGGAFINGPTGPL
jgi:hypothetical protein